MSVESVTQNVVFEFPAFAENRRQLTIKAQAQGNTDANSYEHVILFTMDGRSLSRNKSKFTRTKSVWEFTTVSNIETIRAFFREGDGHYFKYTHFDGTEWYFIILDSSFTVTSTKGKIFYYEGNVRRDLVTHDFSLTVERWAV